MTHNSERVLRNITHSSDSTVHEAQSILTGTFHWLPSTSGPLPSDYHDMILSNLSQIALIPRALDSRLPRVTFDETISFGAKPHRAAADGRKAGRSVSNRRCGADPGNVS